MRLRCEFKSFFIIHYGPRKRMYRWARFSAERHAIWTMLCFVKNSLKLCICHSYNFGIAVNSSSVQVFDIRKNSDTRVVELFYFSVIKSVDKKVIKLQSRVTILKCNDVTVQ